MSVNIVVPRSVSAGAADPTTLNQSGDPNQYPTQTRDVQQPLTVSEKTPAREAETKDQLQTATDPLPAKDSLTTINNSNSPKGSSKQKAVQKPPALTIITTTTGSSIMNIPEQMSKQQPRDSNLKEMEEECDSPDTATATTAPSTPASITSPSIIPQQHIQSPPMHQQRVSKILEKKKLQQQLVDLGQLNTDEELALEEDIKARRLARRQQNKVHHTYADDDDDIEDRHLPHIGTRVTEGHRNYQLMYDMLTGIRIAVGRVSAKITRPLTPEDFAAAHKLVFDVTGNELTPGVKYDFKFKDYAPWVFRYLREKFHVDPADYMMSLTNKYILSEIGSPGKSGSFFYYSRDYRFIIKTIHHTEHKFLRAILKEYYEHVSRNPNTLLCRFYGLHRIKLPHGKKIHFIIMGNVLPSNKDIHETFDLKGSLYGRFTSDEEIRKNPQAIQKDQNWVKQHRRIQLGPHKRALLLTQLERDVEILKTLNIMDYSLLVGIHDLNKGNTEGIRDQNLQMVVPSPTDHRQHNLPHSPLRKRTSRTEKADIVRKALKNANLINIDTSELPASPSEERKWCIFYADDGGFRSTDEYDIPLDNLYYVGVIDILTPYTLVKRAEHLWKSMTQDKDTISSVHPLFYGKRFMDFMVKAVNGTFTKPASTTEDREDNKPK